LTSYEKTRRATFATPHLRAADAYLVKRAKGQTIIAGYPWFGDWGRDTFIALRGLCLATGRLREARDILTAWAATVSQGMLPNRFPDTGGEPEYNSVDASLWYVIVVNEFLVAAKSDPSLDTAADVLLAAAEEILLGYSVGTRFGIRADTDGLLACGVPGVQLTWMDAVVGDRVVTPRIGKPVEVQALWLSALGLASRHDARWQRPFEEGCASFHDRFWNEKRGCLYDVIDVDHQPGVFDDRVRPNQIFAVGGLPLALMEGARAEKVVQIVEGKLWTPMGLRSLAPDEPGYAPHYEGNAVRSATPPTTRAPSGRGSPPPSSTPGSASAATPPKPANRPAPSSSNPNSPASICPASITSPKSPTATRPTPPAAAPSRPGPSAKSSASKNRFFSRLPKTPSS
jgi:predicted glycogen debranching enzyme